MKIKMTADIFGPGGRLLEHGKTYDDLPDPDAQRIIRAGNAVEAKSRSGRDGGRQGSLINPTEPDE
jgi:hypothetical protein